MTTFLVSAVLAIVAYTIWPFTSHTCEYDSMDALLRDHVRAMREHGRLYGDFSLLEKAQRDWDDHRRERMERQKELRALKSLLKDLLKHLRTHGYPNGIFTKLTPSSVCILINETQVAPPDTIMSDSHRSDTNDMWADYLHYVIASMFSVLPRLTNLAVVVCSDTKESDIDGYRYLYLDLSAERRVFERIPDNVSGKRFLAFFQVQCHDLKDMTPWEWGNHAYAERQIASDPEVVPSSMDSLTPESFEHFVGKLLSKWGYDYEVTSRTRDGGIDIRASNDEPIAGMTLVVQCKYYSPGNNVGISAVRELYGVVHDTRANKGILVTTSDFSCDARSFALDKQIELINGDDLRRLFTEARF